MSTAVALLLFTACSSDDVTAPLPSGGDEISASEAAAISEFLTSAAFQAWDFEDIGGGGGAALHSGVPIAIDYSVDASVACPLGGQIGVQGAISGSIDDATYSGSLDLQVATTATACGFLAEATQFTLDTSPALVLTGAFSFDQGQMVGDAVFGYAGGVLWAADDGRSGSCTYDVSVTVSQTGSVVESGTVCGQAL
ncbi:MAG: hypothetical protein R3195_00275 [Gemmatimonadota bacterium]|nr:hypothetical protein [Gemmatimonadota bacterium]